MHTCKTAPRIEQSHKHYTCSISHNARFRTEICTFLFWMLHCEIWDPYIVGFVNLHLFHIPQCAIQNITYCVSLIHTMIYVRQSNFRQIKICTCIFDWPFSMSPILWPASNSCASLVVSPINKALSDLVEVSVLKVTSQWIDLGFTNVGSFRLCIKYEMSLVKTRH